MLGTTNIKLCVCVCVCVCVIVNSVHKGVSIIIIALEMAFIYIVGLETSLRAERYGDRILTKTRFSAPVQADHGVHPAL